MTIDVKSKVMNMSFENFMGLPETVQRHHLKTKEFLNIDHNFP